ncbi:MAG: glycosyltransferase, partial [Acidimicrobiia bacterium]
AGRRGGGGGPPAPPHRWGATPPGPPRAARAAGAVPVYWLRLARRLRRDRPAVVHVVDARGMVLAGVPARLAGARVLWHVQLPVGGTVVNRLGLRCAHAVATASAAAAAGLPSGRRRPSVTVVPNVASDEALRLGPVAPATAPHLVLLGRVHPQKGIDVLIRAMAILADRYPGLRATVAGDADPGRPEEGARLLALADSLGMGGRVELVGFVDRPEDVLAGARVYVQPSRHEALPLAILEAMAMGLPVVAADVGGVAELVRHGVNGLLVPPEDPAALAAAIDRVLTEPGLAGRLGAAARATATEGAYSPAQLVSTFAGLYEVLTGKDLG